MTESTTTQARRARIFRGSAFPALLFAIAAAAVMAVQLFKPPAIALADNTDFRRISLQSGISGAPTFFQFAYLKFPFCQRERIEYASTERLFCELARAANRGILGRETFDVRFLGFFHAAAYSAALFLFAAGLRLRPVSQFAFLAICLFMLVDDRIVSYFNSFYSESASAIFLLLTVGAMLALYAENPSRASRRGRWLFFLACSLLLGFSKSQHLVLLVPLWGFGVCAARQRMAGPAARWIWIGASALLMLGGLWFGIASRAYAATKNVNVQTVLEEEIQPHSPDYAGDLAQMGATKRDIRRVTLGRIGLFYARHPVRYWQMLERRAGLAFSHLPLGCYTEADYPNGWELSAKFSYWWRFKYCHFPKRLWFVLGTLAAAALWGAYNHSKAPAPWAAHAGLVAATLAAMAAGAFLVATTFEANGTEKHLFLFNVLFDLAVAFALLPLLAARPPARENPRAGRGEA